MSNQITKVLVRDTDMISAKSILELLGSSIAGMRQQATEDTKLTEQNKLAIAGAIEALTDLHNLILSQLQDSRNAEAFDDDTEHGGEFDA